MNRTIIKIDESKCDGCGLCAAACAESAIRIVDGKAKLVGDSYCDGLGACLGECPRGALTLEQRPAEPFDAQAAHRAAEASKPAAPAAPTLPCGCPGSMQRALKPQAAQAQVRANTPPSQLSNWPVQLTLVSPNAPYLRSEERRVG